MARNEEGLLYSQAMTNKTKETIFAQSRDERDGTVSRFHRKKCTDYVFEFNRVFNSPAMDFPQKILGPTACGRKEPLHKS